MKNTAGPQQRYQSSVITAAVTKIDAVQLIGLASLATEQRKLVELSRSPRPAGMTK